MIDDADRLARGTASLRAGVLAPRVDTEPVVYHSMPTIIACMVNGTAALMILGVQPVLLGALTEAHRLAEDQLGFLATVEILALALGSAIGPSFVARGAIWQKTAILSLLLAGANMAIYIVHTVPMLDLLRATAGLIEGLLLGTTIVVTTMDRHPDRLNAIFLAVSTIPQALTAYLLPMWIVPHFGANGGFVVLACVSLLSAAFALFLSNDHSTQQSTDTTKTIWTIPIIFAFAAVVLQNAAIGGAWGYIELLSEQHHFGAQAVSIAVSGGLIFQILGALSVAAWGWRMPFKAALLIGSLCQAAVIILLAVAKTPLLYVGPALAFGLFWLALYPFQVCLLIELDKSRSAALILTSVTLVGLSVGPAVSAWGVRGMNVTGAFWIAAGLMLASTVFYSLAAIRPDRLRALRLR